MNRDDWESRQRDAGTVQGDDGYTVNRDDWESRETQGPTRMMMVRLRTDEQR